MSKMKKHAFILIVIVIAAIFSIVSPISAQEESRAIVISTAADAGEGSLRAALEDAKPGDHISFDPAVFPVEYPTRILLERPLPNLETGQIFIDGKDVGVVLDGSLLGYTSDTGFIDDIQLLDQSGENLIKNGDFQENLAYWATWNVEGAETARWVADEGVNAPGAIELAPSPRSGAITLSYNESNEEISLSGAENHPSGVVSPIPVYGLKTLTLSFRHKEVDLGIVMEVNNQDGSGSYDSYDYEVRSSDAWTEEILEFELPNGATDLFLHFNIFTKDAYHGLTITSDGNTIQGLQIENFPGDAIAIYDGSQNQIGGARQSMNAPCVSPCNLLSGNIGSGVFIQGGAENRVQGNFLGTDMSGKNAQGNGLNGVRIFTSNSNLIGGSDGEGNIFAANSMQIEINEDASYNEIKGNFIGVDISGTVPLGSDQAGLSFSDNAHHNLVEKNVIAGNETGISIANNSHHNQVVNNFIGTDLSHSLTLGNQVGILIFNNAYQNEIGPGNYILYNRDAGVYLAGSGARGNRITQNTILDNANNQIVVSTLADDWISAPTTVTATTRRVAGISEPNSEIEIYTSPSKDGGRYLKTAFADESGAFSVTFAEGEITDDYITLLAFSDDGSTSQFSASIAPEALPFRAPPGLIRPEDVSTDIHVIGINAFLAIFTLLYVGVGSTYFNEALENYPDEIDALVITPTQKLLNRLLPWRKAKPKPYDLRRVLLSWFLILLIVSAIQSLLDVESLFSINQVQLIWTLFLGGLTVSGLQTLGELAMRKGFKNTAEIEQAKVGWPATVLAGISTLLSLIFQLVPGLVLGAVDTFFLKPDLKDERLEAWRVLITKTTVLGITFLGWWCYSASAGKAMPLLETLFIVGLQYAFFELMPLDVLDGSILLSQQKWTWYMIWGVLMGLTSFGMYHFALNPNASDVRDVMQSSVSSVAWVFSLLGVAVVSMRWAIARYRKEKFELTRAAWLTIVFIIFFFLVSLLVQFGLI